MVRLQLHRAVHLATAVCVLASLEVPAQGRQQHQEVPVTIKELNVEEAMREFQAFQRELDRYRGEISEGQKTAIETAQILKELRNSANADNNYNEDKILEAARGYIEGVVTKQVELVDFLESQRYRVSYYANQMAASVGPRNLVLLFGSETDNTAALRRRVGAVASSQAAIADFVDRFRRALGPALSRHRSLERQDLDGPGGLLRRARRGALRRTLQAPDGG